MRISLLKTATAVVSATLIFSWVGSVAGQDAEVPPPDDPPTSEAAEPDASSARELLALVGLDESFFAGFVDGQPLDDAEREKLYTLLDRLRRIAPATMQGFEKPARAMFAMATNPAASRGEVVSLPGYVEEVQRVELAPALREKLGFDACYRCRLTSYSGTSLTLYALSVPRAWLRSDPIGERASAPAMFIKLLPPGPGEAVEVPKRRNSFGIPTIRGSLLFATARVAWHPATLLGELGMDVGLLDEVTDKTGLKETECFYRMLAAVRGAEDGRIERAGRENLAKRREFLERLVRNRELGPNARAAAERALDRADEDADDIVPLFNEPAEQRGKLFVLPGEALRAIEIRVDDPDIVKRFGIDHYYEVEIVTADSQNNPIVCCVARLPPDMPLGQSIHENVRVTGFFLKSWAFETPKSRTASGSGRRQQLAPLLIATTVEVLGAPSAPAESAIWAIVLVAAIVFLAAVAWYVWRGDRRAIAKAAGALDAPPPAPEGWDERSRKTL